jgi:hypothetical protein
MNFLLAESRLQASRAAMPSIVAAPASISDRHSRPRAIAVTRFVRVSERQKGFGS